MQTCLVHLQFNIFSEVFAYDKIHRSPFWLNVLSSVVFLLAYLSVTHHKSSVYKMARMRCVILYTDSYVHIHHSAIRYLCLQAFPLFNVTTGPLLPLLLWFLHSTPTLISVALPTLAKQSVKPMSRNSLSWSRKWRSPIRLGVRRKWKSGRQGNTPTTPKHKHNKKQALQQQHWLSEKQFYYRYSYSNHSESHFS